MGGNEEDERVQSIWRINGPPVTRVPLETQHNNGERRGGWWWKMDVYGGWIPYAGLPSDGSNRPGSGSPSQIPILDHQWESRKTDHKSASRVSLCLSIRPLCITLLHSLYSFIQDDMQRMLYGNKVFFKVNLTLLTTRLWRPRLMSSTSRFSDTKMRSVHLCLITWT